MIVSFCGYVCSCSCSFASSLCGGRPTCQTKVIKGFPLHAINIISGDLVAPHQVPAKVGNLTHHHVHKGEQQHAHLCRLRVVLLGSFFCLCLVQVCEVQVVARGAAGLLLLCLLQKGNVVVWKMGMGMDRKGRVGGEEGGEFCPSL